MTTRSRKNDPELEAGTTAHYDNPAYYTRTYKSRLDDVRFYVDLAGASSGPVLEYGCGNGRITIPMARNGTTVVGVDRSIEMLDDLRARLRDEPDDVQAHVTLKRGDMRQAKLGRRFPLVLCPFNAFLHLYGREDVEKFLARVRAHLTPRGEFIFDVSMPEPAELARDPARAYHTPRFRYPSEDGSSETLVRYSERFDYDKLRQVLFVSMEFSPVDGGEPWMTPLAHRQFYPQELEALLHYNGFEITRLDGDFEGSPVTNESMTLLVHTRARGSRRK
ncbi:MAG TPA: class I SAM-dependent methyltransferase [Polyangium sp.]|nr:class I SAM-dependent methyltransferase [Polyangium sp.]